MKKISQISLMVWGWLALVSPAQASFIDVPADHPYFKAISYLEEQGVVEGYGDGKYMPDIIVNRVEMLKIALLGSHIDVPEVTTQEIIFPDVLPEIWYAKYVKKAKELGIVSGDGDTGMFRPGDPVQLDEALKILMKTKNIQTTQPPENPYWDVPASSWSAPYFHYAKTIGMFPEAAGGNVEPAKQVKRGLMADLMYQLEIKPEGYEEGKASFYGIRVHGSGTASGEKFDAYALTAAHKTLPFGTMVLVRSLENDKTVTVRINDRGPYTDGRIIDLSQAAFEVLAPLSRGVIPVSIVPLKASSPEATADCSAKDKLGSIPKEAFENIQLDRNIPAQALETEALYLSGTTNSNDPKVTAFLINDKNQQFPFYTQKQSDGRFSLQVFFPSPGKYKLGLLTGESGSSVAHEITVLSQSCLPMTTDPGMAPLRDLHFHLNQGHLELRWQDDFNYPLTRVIFTQGTRKNEYIVHQQDKLQPHYADFLGWSQGTVNVEIQGAKLENTSILALDELRWSTGMSVEFNATTHHDYQIEEESSKILALPLTLKAGQSMAIELDPLVNLRDEGLVILPNGQVEEDSLTSETHDPLVNAQGISILPATAAEVKFSFTPQTNDVHFFEINAEDGIAVINIPVYPENLYPLLPSPTDFNTLEPETLTSDLNVVRNQMLELVNKDRTIYGLAPLKLDSVLSELAQSRTDDMVERQYLSHWNPDGLTANDLRKNFAITQYVSENIARDSSLKLAQYGLMRSALHRQNILDSEWKRAGFGITRDSEGGGYILVQIFSDDPINFSNVEDLRKRAMTTLNEKRSTPILADDKLTTIAQEWSQRMITEDFFNFTAPNGETLVDTMRDRGISGTLGTYIVGNSSFDSALEKISSNAQLQESRWKKLGIGIKQDKFGIIKFTLAYTE